jgi:Tfp pilus assembly protein PilV
MMKNMQKGITLIELVVAVGVLMYAVAGPMTLAASSLRATRDAERQLVATHLAEEAFEVLHSIRDNNSTNVEPSETSRWMDEDVDIISACGGHGCIVDVSKHAPANWASDALVQCDAPGCEGQSALFVHSITGLYRQKGSALTGGWSKTPYTRYVRVTVVDATREVQVESRVTFESVTGKTREVVVEGVLYNWFPSLQ